MLDDAAALTRRRLDQAAQPGSAVRALARYASLAVRLDPPLLRCLRLALMPATPASAEADLWFSSLSESRDADFFVFDAEIAALLRQELLLEVLPDGRRALDVVQALLADQHAQWAPAHRLEELLTYLGLRDDAGWPPLDDPDALLGPVLAAMAADPQRAVEVSRWAARALPRLPAGARSGDAAGALALAAAVRLGVPLGSRAIAPGRPLPTMLRWLLPDPGPDGWTTLVCEVGQRSIRLRVAREGDEGLPRVALPTTQPLLVELRTWSRSGDGSGTVQVHAFAPDEALAVPEGWQRIELRSATGQGWRIERAAAADPDGSRRQPVCLVIQGFGEQTDYRTGRVLDLDQSYRLIIQKAVVDAGLRCIRSDEITHSGTIGVPMYEQLLDADLVIADLSTSNLNAVYELGIRHALRPNNTLIIAEKQFDAPFDVNHIHVRKYGREGKSLNSDEVEQFREQLTAAIKTIMAQPGVDSPVYTFLELQPPVRNDGDASPGPSTAAADAPKSPTCFVVMGFGEKTDYRTSRVVDLNKTYRYIIKKAVVAAGLECIRADEISHSGTIDVPMYEQLLDADLVIADLSTSNLNTAYELGIRHALRPHATLVIAEDQFVSPFDVNHVVVHRFRHDGKALDIDVAEEFSAKLTALIKSTMAHRRVDSPVYTFLPLRSPSRKRASAALPADSAPSLSSLMEQVRECKGRADYGTAKQLLQAARAIAPNDVYLVQQLALVTYKSKQPDERTALDEARAILETLDPLNVNDAETLGLWGAIHKRRHALDGRRADLDMAIVGYDKGYRLLNDHYNGINLAYLLTLRAAEARSSAEAIANLQLARGTHSEVLALCQRQLDTMKDSVDTRSDRYWVMATAAEAAIGLGDEAAAAAWQARALPLAPEPFMAGTLNDPFSKLRTLMAAAQARSRQANG